MATCCWWISTRPRRGDVTRRRPARPLRSSRAPLGSRSWTALRPARARARRRVCRARRRRARAGRQRDRGHGQRRGDVRWRGRWRVGVGVRIGGWFGRRWWFERRFERWIGREQRQLGRRVDVHGVGAGVRHRGCVHRGRQRLRLQPWCAGRSVRAAERLPHRHLRVAAHRCDRAGGVLGAAVRLAGGTVRDRGQLRAAERGRDRVLARQRGRTLQHRCAVPEHDVLELHTAVPVAGGHAAAAVPVRCARARPRART